MELDPDRAVQAILTGRGSEGLIVNGFLDLKGVVRSFRLPQGLTVRGPLDLSGSAVTELPDDLQVDGVIAASRCSSLRAVGKRIKASSIILSHCARLERLTEPMEFTRVILDGCTALMQLPDAVRGVEFSVSGCTALTALPSRLRVNLLRIEGCPNLRGEASALGHIDQVIADDRTGIPYDWQTFQVSSYLAHRWVANGRALDGLNVLEGISFANHVWLRELPRALVVHGNLDLQGCTSLRKLPDTLIVHGTLTLTGSGITEIPPSARAEKAILPNGRPAEVQPPKKPSWLSTAARVGAAVGFLTDAAPNSQKRIIPSQAVGAADARRAIAAGAASVIVREDLVLEGLSLDKLPSRLWVLGSLRLQDLPSLAEMPRDLRVERELTIVNCPSLRSLPAIVSAQRVTLQRCPALKQLPEITCDQLSVSECDSLEEVPASVFAYGHVQIARCSQLRLVSPSLPAGTIAIADVPLLEKISLCRSTRALDLADLPLVRTLPESPAVMALSVKRMENLVSLPANLDLKSLEIDRCPALRELPAALRCSEQLAVHRSPIRWIPADTRTLAFVASELPDLEEIRADWTEMRELIARDCRELTRLPSSLRAVRDHLSVEGCRQLSSLPDSLEVTGRLDVRHCSLLRRLPESMPPPETAEVGNSGLERLPEGWGSVKLTWLGRIMSERQLFHTDTLSVEEILGEPNVEIRRVLIERAGLQRLIDAPGAAIVDEDTDAGGRRRLIRVPVPNGEAILTLEVICPTTSRVFYLRVLPGLTSCRHAAAWVAGFLRPEDYNPIVET